MRQIIYTLTFFKVVEYKNQDMVASKDILARAAARSPSRPRDTASSASSARSVPPGALLAGCEVQAAKVMPRFS